MCVWESERLSLRLLFPTSLRAICETEFPQAIAAKEHTPAHQYQSTTTQFKVRTFGISLIVDLITCVVIIVVTAWVAILSLISRNRYLRMNMPNLQSFGEELPKMHASQQFLCRIKEVWHAEMQSKKITSYCLTLIFFFSSSFSNLPAFINDAWNRKSWKRSLLASVWAQNCWHRLQMLIIQTSQWVPRLLIHKPYT